MSCGEPAFWNNMISNHSMEELERAALSSEMDQVPLSISISDDNPFAKSVADEIKEEMEKEIFSNIIDKIASLPAPDHFVGMANPIGATKNPVNNIADAFKTLPVHHLGGDVYTNPVTKKYVDNAVAGQMMVDEDTKQVLVYDGTDQWTIAAPPPPEPNGMVGALTIRNEAGEEMDVCSTILKLEDRIKKLERDVLLHKINTLADELDERKVKDKYIEIPGESFMDRITRLPEDSTTVADILKQLTADDNDDAFDRAMGGV